MNIADVLPDEFRSPLHGILASAEFLRDTRLDSTQSELVGSIQNCSGTLLVRYHLQQHERCVLKEFKQDTINHVLDYSKINSFEIAGNKEGSSSIRQVLLNEIDNFHRSANKSIISSHQPCPALRDRHRRSYCCKSISSQFFG